MFILDLTNPLTLILVIIATALVIFLGQKIKSSAITLIPLIFFLVLLVIHIVQVLTLDIEYAHLSGLLYKCIAIDFIFILITFFTYRWVDKLEAKKYDRKMDWLRK